jgi:hypothetical protein
MAGVPVYSARGEWVPRMDIWYVFIFFWLVIAVVVSAIVVAQANDRRRERAFLKSRLSRKPLPLINLPPPDDRARTAGRNAAYARNRARIRGWAA